MNAHRSDDLPVSTIPNSSTPVIDEPPEFTDGSSDVLTLAPVKAPLDSPNLDREPVPAKVEQAGRLTRIWGGFKKLVWTLFCLASLAGCLAVVTAAPILQLASLGYLLLVAGRIASGATIRQSLPGLESAGKIGCVFLALGIASLPTRLLAHWESVATIIEPDSPTASLMRFGAIAFSLFATVHLWWAWARGGSLRHYLWPQPIRFIREAWRPKTWNDVADRLWHFIVSLQLPRLFWLGLRGAAGTLVWLIPGMLIMAVTRGGNPAAAGVVGIVCLLLLAWVMMYLPMLQTRFAAENRLRTLFAWRDVRRDFYYAPWSWALAMLIGLVLMPIPLYLLKVEATPQELTWLPCLVFVAFMLPARIAEGLAMRRCRRLRLSTEARERGFPPGTALNLTDNPTNAAFQPTGIVVANEPSQKFIPRNWRTLSCWGVRLAILPVIVGFYMLVLSLSQYTSWDGIDTWVRQHALLVPVPFVGV